MSGFVSAQQDKDLKENTVLALIEVTDEKGGSQGMDGLLYAKRQAEIMKSKRVLKILEGELGLARKWSMTVEQAVTNLEGELNCAVTEAGLIIPNIKAGKHDDFTLKLLSTWVKAYVRHKDEAIKYKIKLEIDHLIDGVAKLTEERNISLQNYTNRCAKYGVEKEGDVSKLTIKESLALDDNRKEIENLLTQIQHTNATMEKLKAKFSEARKFVKWHSNPFLTEGSFLKTINDLKYRLLEGEDRK